MVLENYKTQLNEMIVLYHAGAVAGKYGKICFVDRAEISNTPQTMENSEVIEVNQHQIEHLNAHLSGFC